MRFVVQDSTRERADLKTARQHLLANARSVLTRLKRDKGAYLLRSPSVGTPKVHYLSVTSASRDGGCMQVRHPGCGHPRLGWLHGHLPSPAPPSRPRCTRDRWGSNDRGTALPPGIYAVRRAAAQWSRARHASEPSGDAVRPTIRGNVCPSHVIGTSAPRPTEYGEGSLGRSMSRDDLPSLARRKPLGRHSPASCWCKFLPHLTSAQYLAIFRSCLLCPDQRLVGDYCVPLSVAFEIQAVTI